jgi:hypothetical protein
MKKPYRSLADIYADNAYKAVPKLQRQSLNEGSLVMFKNDGEEKPQILGYVDDETAHKLQRQVLASSEGVVKIINGILEQARWATGNIKEYKQKILGPILNIVYENTDINKKELKTFYTKKKQKTAFMSAMMEAIKNEDTFNIKDVLVEETRNVFSDPGKTITELFLVNPSISNVGVGKGEICITMFSNAVQSLKGNGQKGDIFIAGFGDVELKGSGGRAGTSPGAHEAAKILQKILTSKNKGLLKLDHAIEKLNLKLTNEFNKLTNELKTPKLFRAPKKNEIDYKEYANELIRRLNKVYTNVKPKNGYTDKDQVESDIEGTSEYSIDDNNNISIEELPLDAVVARSLIKNTSVTRFLRDVRQFGSDAQELVKAYTNKNYMPKIAVGKRDLTKSEPLYHFFNNNKFDLDTNDLANGFLAWKNMKDKHFTDDLKGNILTGLKQIIDDKENLLIMRSRDGNKPTHQAKQLIDAIIASLQLTLYATEENFKSVLFFNNESLEAYSFLFETKNPAKNLISCFDQVYTVIKKGIFAVEDISVDDRSKGVSMVLKK